MDRRNGISDEDWNDDGVCRPEKESHENLLSIYENEVRRQQYDPDRIYRRSVYSLGELRDEILRRMGEDDESFKVAP